MSTADTEKDLLQQYRFFHELGRKCTAALARRVPIGQHLVFPPAPSVDDPDVNARLIAAIRIAGFASGARTLKGELIDEDGSDASDTMQSYKCPVCTSTVQATPGMTQADLEADHAMAEEMLESTVQTVMDLA